MSTRALSSFSCAPTNVFFCRLCLCEKFHGERIFFMWSFWLDIKLQWFEQLSGTAGTHYFADTYKLRVTPYRVSAQSWNSTKKYFSGVKFRVYADPALGFCTLGTDYQKSEGAGELFWWKKHTTTKNSIQEFWWAEKMYKVGTWMKEKVRTS